MTVRPFATFALAKVAVEPFVESETLAASPAKTPFKTTLPALSVAAVVPV